LFPKYTSKPASASSKANDFLSLRSQADAEENKPCWIKTTGAVSFDF